MGAEVGATTTAFPFSPAMSDYLVATGRSPVAQAANWAASQGFLSADKDAEYDEVIEIVSTTSPALGYFFDSAFRISRNLNPQSMDPSHPIWQPHYPSSLHR